MFALQDLPHSDVVQVELDGAVAIVTLSRPHRLNAITFAVLRDLRAALLALGDETSVRAVVLTGQGRAFCAGLDLDEGLADPSIDDPVEATHAGMRTGAGVTAAIRGIPQPVIAAVQGHAVGAGLAFAAAADVRLIAADAKFAAPFLPLGMTAGDFGLSWTLPRLIGQGRAAALIYGAGRLDAAQALEYGFASAIERDPLQAAREYANVIASYAPYGVQGTKRLLESGWNSAFPAHLESEAEAQTIGALSAAAQDAFAAALAATKRSKE
jgi:enoyl-CoA hydratase/carnithine racemase